jgi:hypothetical protein
LQLSQSLAALRVGVGKYQVGQTLDAGQIKLAILKGAAREFAGLRRAQTLDLRQRIEYGRDDRTPAMHLQFDGVLSRLAFWAGKEQRQRIVNGFPGSRIAQPCEGSLARLRQSAGKGFQRIAGPRSGNADDSDGNRGAAGREGINGVTGRHESISSGNRNIFLIPRLAGFRRLEQACLSAVDPE